MARAPVPPPSRLRPLCAPCQAAEGAVRTSMATACTDALLPGMILNTGKKMCYWDALAGEERAVPAGRLECTMQNLADVMGEARDAPLERDDDKAALRTFLVYNQRRKVTSSAKRQRKPGSTHIHQTPDGSFYDLQRNAADLLALCGIHAPEVRVAVVVWGRGARHAGGQAGGAQAPTPLPPPSTPQVGAVAEYLERGPGLIFLFHPALGPLWEVVAQKLRGGRLAPRAEVQLEVAEVCWCDVSVDGSLLVRADAVMGHTQQQQQEERGEAGGDALLAYSARCGRVRMHNVRVENKVRRGGGGRGV